MTEEFEELDWSTMGTPEGQHMIRLLWDPPTPPSRGPRQKLSLDAVVEAGMRLAERDGVDALSMRKVAAELGVGAMSLYTYVPGRDELFELMIDRAWGDRERSAPDAPWRARVTQIAETAWAMYQAHPWLVWSSQWRMPLGPHVMDAQEDLYRALDAGGLAPLDVSRAASLVEGHVFAHARISIIDNRLAAQTGVSIDSHWDSRASFWGTYFDPERFSHTVRLWEHGAFDQAMGSIEEMRFGLELILDGIEKLTG